MGSDPHTKPFQDIARNGRQTIEFAGTFQNDFYGPLTVSVKDGGPAMTLAPKGMQFSLRHYAGDMFFYETTGKTPPDFPGWASAQAAAVLRRCA